MVLVRSIFLVYKTLLFSMSCPQGSDNSLVALQWQLSLVRAGGVAKDLFGVLHPRYWWVRFHPLPEVRSQYLVPEQLVAG